MVKVWDAFLTYARKRPDVALKGQKNDFRDAGQHSCQPSLRALAGQNKAPQI